MKKRKDSDNLFMKIILLLLILGMSLYVGYQLRLEGPGFFSRLLGRGDPTPPLIEEKVDWKKLERIKRYIENQYNGPIVDTKLLEGALKGMVGTLDNAGGQYFNAVEYNDILNRNQKTHGAGIYLGTQNGKIVVISTDSGSQGEKSGVLPGDIVFKINDKVTISSEIETVRNLLRSNENRTVQLNILRGEEHVELNVRLRELVKPSIETKLQEQIGIIRLPGFSVDMGTEFGAVLDTLVKENPRGIILDLRNTPTGQLTEGVEIASKFIPKDQKIVSIRDTNGKIRDFVSNSGQYSYLPLVVLINEQTEGTAEFVAGALQAMDQVTVIGQKSLGEGRIYSYINLPEGEGIKLATGFVLLPSGAEIQINGIKPDVFIAGEEIMSTPVPDQDAQLNKALEIIAEKLKH